MPTRSRRLPFLRVKEIRDFNAVCVYVHGVIGGGVIKFTHISRGHERNVSGLSFDLRRKNVLFACLLKQNVKKRDYFKILWTQECRHAPLITSSSLTVRRRSIIRIIIIIIFLSHVWQSPTVCEQVNNLNRSLSFFLSYGIRSGN